MNTTPSFETLIVTLEDHIATVRLNRPEKANAMNAAMWQEIRQAFTWVDATPEARVAVLQGEGRYFTAGIDLQLMMGLGPQIANECDGRTREALRRVILDMQDTLTSLERCRKPVLAAIHGGCIGGGIDLITCADMRYCSSDAYFSIKEIDMGMAADVGTLQRLPKIIPEGVAREYAYTGRRMSADRAREVGLVNEVFATHDELVGGALDVAREIASKSPLAVWGSKETLNYGRDHSVADALNYIATWQTGMFQPADMMEAFAAKGDKRDAEFQDLPPRPDGL